MPDPGSTLRGGAPAAGVWGSHRGPAAGEPAANQGRDMIFQFTYDWSVLGVIVAPDIEGAADIGFDRNGNWTVDAVRVEQHDGEKSVILPDDHPLCTDIKIWLLTAKRDEIDEAVGAEIPRNDPYREHRHSVRELV